MPNGPGCAPACAGARLLALSGIRIREDDLAGDDIARFLREHLEEMYEITPPQSVRAFDLEALRSPGITFWSAWRKDKLLGCAALREIDAGTGEIKSMRVSKAHRGEGLGSKILEHIIGEAKRRDYEYLKLETGALPEFEAARAFYLRYGFEYCGPFADYPDDPNSAFLEKRLRT